MKDVPKHCKINIELTMSCCDLQAAKYAIDNLVRSMMKKKKIKNVYVFKAVIGIPERIGGEKP